MKVLFNSLSGKSLSLDVLPTDTFVDLQSRALQKAGCLVYIYTYILVTLKCIFPVTEELNKFEVKDGGDVYRETGVSEESVNVCKTDRQ
jgi:hypothetical protein